MPTLEAQLETWSNPGAGVSAQATHTSIRAALCANTSPIREMLTRGDVEIYLQGSYKNHTNIRGDSDVDVVVELKSTFSHETSALTPVDLGRFRQIYPVPTYCWNDFRGNVLTALQYYYGRSVQITPVKKALRVPRMSGTVGAHVIVAVEHREYSYFAGGVTQPSRIGVAFWSQPDNRRVVNFPKQHCENGEQKNSAQRAAGWYKPSVRIFKNARSYLVERGKLGEYVAPSYFVESLLFNVPDSCFGRSYSDTVIAAWNWLETACNPAALTCPNGQTLLFGHSPEQWSIESAQAFLLAFKDLWENWHR